MSEIEAPFIAAVRAYCAWVDSVPEAPEEEARLALRLLSRLYCEAVVLPAGNCGRDLAGQRMSHETWMEKHRRFASMPFQYYHEYHQPSDLDHDNSGMGDVGDDLADIYRDVADALALYDAGHVIEALWEFRHSFRTHWGRHAVGAIVDDPDQYPPTHHSWLSHNLSWVILGDGLPAYPKSKDAAS